MRAGYGGFGMVVGRVVSAVSDRSVSKVVVLYLVIEGTPESDP